MHVWELYPLGWQFLQAKLLEVCSPPGIRAWVKLAAHELPACLWHEAQSVP